MKTLLRTAVAGALALLSMAAAVNASAAPRGRAPTYYVSLGDSYAAGYQPTGPRGGHATTNGFAYQVPALAARRGYRFTLVNYGCGGATTTSILTATSCPLLGPGAPPYPPLTQAAAAEAFIRSHRSRMGLITVSIGGNDVTHCTTAAQPVPCVGQAVTAIEHNLAILLTGLRAAAGPRVPIVGTTYPDVILGLYTSGQAAQKALAALSVVAFRDLVNPALKRQYESVGGTFVDVTAATGAYGPLTRTTTLPPYGVIPVPVARVCMLTYFCQYHDIHPRTAGYTIIARLVAATLPGRR